MPARKLTVLIGLLLCASAHAASSTSAESADIPALINSLSDPDAAVRERATRKLETLGPPARPGLLKAIRSPDPERRSRAARILLKLPWDIPDDSVEVRKYLRDYGALDENQRKARLMELYQVPAASPTLLRLLMEEPSDEVRWIIAALIAQDDDDPAMARLREMNVEAADPPVLRLAGQAWWYHDRAKSLSFFARAIESEARNPSSDAGQLDFAFDRLIADALTRRQFDQAADWLRRQIPREMGAGHLAIARLLMLHAHFGPLKGLEGDLRNWGTNRDAINSLITGGATTRPAPGETDLFTAFGITIDVRLAAAFLLLEGKFYDELDKEIRSIVALPAESDERRDAKDASTQLLAVRLHQARDDDQRCADALQQLMVIKTRIDFPLAWRTDDDLWAELYWRRARIAHKHGDTKIMKAQVAQLLLYTPSATDTVIDIVNWLKDAGMQTEARALFERVYVPARKRLDDSDNHPILMNDLAWLCARTNERVDEALSLATKAVAIRPNSAALLDTAAEANFRAGKRDQAIALETQALKLRPLDEFMDTQLTRFKSAAAPATTRTKPQINADERR